MDTVVVVMLLGLSAYFARMAWVYIPNSDRFYIYMTGVIACMFLANQVSKGVMLH